MERVRYLIRILRRYIHSHRRPNFTPGSSNHLQIPGPVIQQKRKGHSRRIEMSPPDITAHAQAPASEPDVAGPDGGEGEVDRSQTEAKDDAALLVGFPVLWRRMHADGL